MSCIIFDFEGTICDSLNAYKDSYNKIAKKLKLTPIDTHLFSINHLREMDIKHVPSYLRLPKLLIPYLAYKLRKDTYKNFNNIKPVAEIANIIHFLNNDGYTLGILSSNRKNYIKKFLYYYNLDYFHFIYTTHNIFNKGKILEKICSKYHLDNKHTLFIGDEVRDIEAAKKAGIVSIAVTWGANTSQLLQTANPNYLVESPEALKELLTSYRT